MLLWAALKPFQTIGSQKKIARRVSRVANRDSTPLFAAFLCQNLSLLYYQ